MIRLAGIGVGGVLIASCIYVDWPMATVTLTGAALLYIFGPRK